MVKVEISGESVLSRKEILKVLRAALRKVGIETAYVSVAFVRRKAIRRLNKIYRNKDKATDILSFGFSKALAEDGEKTRSGELVISEEEARANAKDKKTTLKKELRLLLVHGALHLAGYDHEKVKDEKKMFALQDRILKKL